VDDSGVEIVGSAEGDCDVDNCNVIDCDVIDGEVVIVSVVPVV
jgi:hypothetical protein